MIDKFKEVKAIGFDLDCTLYPPTPEINNKIRNEIAKELLTKKPELQTIQQARQFFEERYQHLQSGTKILEEEGYPQPSQIMDNCLARAEVIDLIQPNPKLAKIIKEISSKFKIYLITSSPKDLARRKLEKIGIDKSSFHLQIFSDTENSNHKQTGKSFESAIKYFGIQASQHVYIGDSRKSDILPAKALGMKTISVGSEIHEADISIKNIEAIRGLFL